MKSLPKIPYIHRIYTALANPWYTIQHKYSQYWRHQQYLRFESNGVEKRMISWFMVLTHPINTLHESNQQLSRQVRILRDSPAPCSLPESLAVHTHVRSAPWARGHLQVRPGFWKHKRVGSQSGVNHAYCELWIPPKPAAFIATACAGGNTLCGTGWSCQFFHIW